MWILYGEESGEQREFKTKKEAIQAMKDTDRFDKEQGLGGERWQIWKEDEET